MKVNDELRKEMVIMIDKISPNFMKKSLISIELQQIRNKYIYRDVGRADFLKDVKYLKDVVDIINRDIFDIKKKSI